MKKIVENKDSSSNNEKALTSFLLSLVGESAPGVCASVCSQSKVLFSFCEGSRQFYPERKPLLATTLFDMASLTKILSTTMVACRLYEKKLLSFSDTIGQFFSMPTPYNDVTVLQLLTHSAGFIAEKRLWDYILRPDDVIKTILTEKPIYKAGTDVVYSCFGYIVLGKILELVGNTSLDILAKNEVFIPLGMHNTGYLPATTNTFAVTEFDEIAGTYCNGIVHDENARFLNGVSGNAGVFSTLHDVTLFCQMLLANGKTSQDVPFLTPKTIALCNTEFAIGNNERRSIGFKLEKTSANKKSDYAVSDTYGHTGFTGTSIMIHPQKKLAAILLTNRVHPSRENKKLLEQRNTFHNLAWALANS